MSEGIVKQYNQFAEFYNTFWSILGNLFVAHSTVFSKLGSPGNIDIRYYNSLAKINKLMADSIFVFNDILHNVIEYKALSEETFSFILDDLQLAIDCSLDISNAVKNQSDEIDVKIGLCSYKLDEIKNKAKKHLMARARVREILG